MIPTVTIFFYFLSFLLFFVSLWFGKERKGIRLFDEDGFVRNRPMLILLHLVGIVVFGIFPLITKAFNSVTGNLSENVLPFSITLVFMLLLTAFGLRQSKRHFTKSVNMLAEVPDASFLILYFLLRIIFICAYETWFRGYLLTDSIHLFGLPIAIMLNLAVYALLHLFNGKQEVLACFPFGLLLCALCIYAGTALPAVLIHLSLTISYEAGIVWRAHQLKHAAI